MKKMFYFVAVTTFALLSCQQEEDPVNDVTKNEPITFKASIENFATRADMDASNGLKWVKDDKIGIYVNDTWEQKNQPFTLSGNGGSSQGEFVWDYGDFTNENATIAFFPWQGTGDTKNNVYNGTMYFKLPDHYDSYTSGQMLTPLIASLANSSSLINFKHAGAAVKVTINNLPAGAHSIGMSVDGQQIYGDYHIDPTKAGTDALILDNADLSKNNVWLNFEPSSSERAFTFIFPVPTLTTPKLSFQIWDKNDILVWSKNLKAQTFDLGRADILDLTAPDIEPYSQFNITSNWGICGDLTGWGSTAVDIQMKADGSDNDNETFFIAKEVEFPAGKLEFKIRYNNTWGGNYGGSSSSSLIVGTPYEVFDDSSVNLSVPEAGTYDIIFYTDKKDNNKKKIRVVNTGECPYPSRQ